MGKRFFPLSDVTTYRIVCRISPCKSCVKTRSHCCALLCSLFFSFFFFFLFFLNVDSFDPYTSIHVSCEIHLCTRISLPNVRKCSSFDDLCAPWDVKRIEASHTDLLVIPSGSKMCIIYKRAIDGNREREGEGERQRKREIERVRERRNNIQLN